MFNLKNREFSFDYDVSSIECGMNAAIYFVEMDSDGGSSKYPLNKAGAKYGTGYCDAQCAQTNFIHGEANVNWNHGGCCSEIDIMEINKEAQAFTVHPCKVPGDYRCEGPECGSGSNRYKGVCDMDGCDLNPYRSGNPKFYGPGTTYTLNSLLPFKVVTQFLTIDGTDAGYLAEIKRFFVQNGKKIEFPKSNISDLTFNSMTTDNCLKQKSAFGENPYFSTAGSLRGLGNAMDRGMVLTMSIWDDAYTKMKWLDGKFPTNADEKKAGVMRGPCAANTGDPETMKKQFPNAQVTFTGLKVGKIGTTVQFQEDGVTEKVDSLTVEQQ